MFSCPSAEPVAPPGSGPVLPEPGHGGSVMVTVVVSLFIQKHLEKERAKAQKKKLKKTAA